jgi:hypothetical protein
MAFRNLFSSAFLPAVALAGSLALIGSITAETASGVPGAASGGGNGRAKVIMELKAARHLLHTAMHDYDGHRAAAVKQITEALHDLQPPPNAAQASASTPQSGSSSSKVTPSGTGNSKAKPIQGTAQAGASQEESDKKLSEAKKILEKVQPHLTQHPKAAEHVANALNDIGKALSIK